MIAKLFLLLFAFDAEELCEPGEKCLTDLTKEVPEDEIGEAHDDWEDALLNNADGSVETKGVIDEACTFASGDVAEEFS